MLDRKGVINTYAQSTIVSYMPTGTRWRTWLMHCATSRKVAGSIPDGVIVYGVSSVSNRNEY